MTSSPTAIRPPLTMSARSPRGAPARAARRGSGDFGQVAARPAQLLPDALHLTDREALADQVVEADAAREHLAAHLGRRQLDAGVLSRPSSASASISVRSRDSA